MLSLLSTLLLGLATAHNWIGSPSRANGASTVQPCNSEQPWAHIQVGSEQEFEQEWMTGHEGTWTYLIVLHESDAWRLAGLKFSDIDRYLEEAPHNMAEDAKWQRYHMAKRTRDHSANIGQQFTREVQYNSGSHKRPQVWIDEGVQFPCDRDPQGNCYPPKVYEYTQEMLAGDMRAKYQHPDEDLSWIEQAAYYAHTLHEPAEFDTSTFAITGRKGPGKYIMHYKWRSYADCVDIDILPEPATDIYGKYAVDAVGSPTYTWRRVDHCTSAQVGDIKGPCRQVLSLPYTSLEECNRFGVNCDAVIMAPTEYPAQVVFPELSHFYPLGANNTDTIFGPITGKFSWAGFYCPENAADIQSLPKGSRVSWPWQITEEPLYISTDPRDPAYYHTCWMKLRPRTHDNGINERNVPNEPPQPKIMDTCMSCRDAVLKKLPYVTPPTEVPTFCEKCDDLENLKVDLLSTNALTDIWYQPLNSGRTRCKAKSCPADNNCLKRLGTDLLGHHESTGYHDCMKLALMDPECNGVAVSSYTGSATDTWREPGGVRKAVADGYVPIEYVTNKYWREQTGLQCFCWKKSTCCGECETETYMNPVASDGCDWSNSGPWKSGHTATPPQNCYPKFGRVFFHNATASAEYRQQVRSITYKFDGWLNWAKNLDGGTNLPPDVLD